MADTLLQLRDAMEEAIRNDSSLASAYREERAALALAAAMREVLRIESPELDEISLIDPNRLPKVDERYRQPLHDMVAGNFSGSIQELAELCGAIGLAAQFRLVKLDGSILDDEEQPNLLWAGTTHTI